MKTMKKESRKLNLNRETLVPLQATELADVNGGITPSIVASIEGFAATVGLYKFFFTR